MTSPQDSRLYLAAAERALAAFPIEGAAIEPLALGENAVFRVVDGLGVSFVLRLHRPDYHPLEHLNAERAWTAALNEAGIPAPNGVRARDGGWYVSAPTPDPQGFRLAGVTTWFEGEILSDVIRREGAATAPEHYARLGAFVARLHRQAADWSPPPGFSRHSLDLHALLGESPFWGRFWESDLLGAEERKVSTAARARIAERLIGLTQTKDTFSLIHADLHPGNVLVAAGQLAVIDFDDSAFGWQAFDVAVALFDVWSRPDYAALRDAFLRGYAAQRPLIADLEQTLPIFLLLRGLMLIGWHDQRPELDPTLFLDGWRARLMTECETLLAT